MQPAVIFKSMCGASGRTLLCAAIFTAITGCGTAEYERRYDKTLEELWRLEPFLQLQEEATAIPLTKPDAKQPITAELRLPKIFDSTAKRYDPAKLGDDPVDPERMLPPFVQSLPDYRFSYEQFIGKPGSAQDSIYLYVCAYTGEDKGKRFRSRLESSVLKAYKGIDRKELKDEWKSEKCPTPDKPKDKSKNKPKPVEWNRLSLRLENQTFAVKESQKVSKKDLDGILEVFVHSDGDKHLMFILRMPISLEKQIDLGALAEACAGTLRWPDSESAEEE